MAAIEASCPIRPCRRDRGTNDVCRQFKFKAKQQPNSKPPPHVPPPTKRAAANKSGGKVNERLDRSASNHQGCRRLNP